jgi:dienelactone hydrolase
MNSPKLASILILSALTLAGCAGNTSNSNASATRSNIYDRENSDRLSAKLSFVAIPVRHGDRNWNLGAVLRIPYGHSEKVPAVIVVHGSGGVDSRGGHYVQMLNQAGIATLEIDLWAARGVRSPAERPRSVVETLPDAFAALDFLAKNENIRPDKIGIMGFSWGGVVSMLTADKKYQEQFAVSPNQSFAAHAPFYPVCWVYNVAPGYEFGNLTSAPVLIQAGLADTYDEPETCSKLVDALAPHDKAHVRLIMYENATHAWERREPDAVAGDPYSHLGKGGDVPLRYNATATEASTNAVIEFFNNNLR